MDGSFEFVFVDFSRIRTAAYSPCISPAAHPSDIHILISAHNAAKTMPAMLAFNQSREEMFVALAFFESVHVADT